MSELPPFPSTAAEFYGLRDHRTDLYDGVVPAYTERAVRVTIDRDTVQTYLGQMMLIITANLLSRWCRRVDLQVPDVVLHARFRLSGSVSELVLKLMRDADPFGDFSACSGGGGFDLQLHIGEDSPASAIPTTVISACGWYASVRRPAKAKWPTRDGLNPVGAVAAAILGGAQLFRDALGLQAVFPPALLYDAFNAKPVQELVERPFEHLGTRHYLGAVLMVGAGSVGSAAAYFMDLFGLEALMRVVDADFVKVENFGRTPAFGRAVYGVSKPTAIKASLVGGSLFVDPVDQWWHEIEEPTLAGYDVIIPVANEHGIRWTIQAGVPPLMVHASTGRNWNVNFGRHVPGRDDCLADRFAGFVEQAVFRCSEGKMPVSEWKIVDASLPFLSFWAGFLIATDLVRLGIEQYPHTPNFGNYSFRKNRFTPQLVDKGPRPDCMCRNQASAFWTLRQGTRFSGLSPTVWK